MKNDIFNTLERKDVCFSEDLLILQSKSAISAVFEAMFDIDKKLGTNTKGKEYWVEMHAMYHPFDDTIKLEYGIFGGEKEYQRQYIPTDEENKMFTDLIKERCLEKEGMNYYTFYLNDYVKYYANGDMSLVCEKGDDGYQVRNTADNFILFKSDDEDMERFVGNDIELVSYGNDETYSIESLDLCEVIFSADAVDCEIDEDDEEMEI